jgi:hypothetical protein
MSSAGDLQATRLTQTDRDREARGVDDRDHRHAPGQDHTYTNRAGPRSFEPSPHRTINDMTYPTAGWVDRYTNDTRTGGSATPLVEHEAGRDPPESCNRHQSRPAAVLDGGELAASSRSLDALPGWPPSDLTRRLRESTKREDGNADRDCGAVQVPAVKPSATGTVPHQQVQHTVSRRADLGGWR